MSVEIREAAANDDVELGHLVEHVYIDEGWSPKSARDRMASGVWVRTQGTVLVAIHDGTLDGSIVVALPGDEGRQVAVHDEVELRLLCVSPESRGAGTGEALVRAAIGRSKEAGFHKIILSTQEGMAAAQRLYTRMGFVRLPKRDWARASGIKMMVYTWLDPEAPEEHKSAWRKLLGH